MDLTFNIFQIPDCIRSHLVWADTAQYNNKSGACYKTYPDEVSLGFYNKETSSSQKVMNFNTFSQTEIPLDFVSFIGITFCDEK